MIEMKGELLLFCVALISGCLLRLVYRILECVRELVSHSRLLISIEDLIFWMGSALYLFVQNYYTSNGGIRWHFILGVVFGATVCSYIGKRLRKSAKKNLHL